jgi:hypothetical protein
MFLLYTRLAAQENASYSVEAFTVSADQNLVPSSPLQLLTGNFTDDHTPGYDG